MADHFVKISEVPKDQRLKYFWDYYKVHTFVVIFVVISLISIIKVTVFRTKEDAFILIAGQGAQVTSDVQSGVKQALSDESFDLNGDGKSYYDIQYIMLSQNDKDITSQMDAEVESVNAMKLTALFSTGNYVLQIVDEKMAEVIIYEGLAAKAESFEGKNYISDNGYVKIPVSETKLKDVFGVQADKYFIIPRGKDALSSGNDKKAGNYENSIKVLDNLLN